MRKIVGINKQINPLIGLIELAKYCGWWSPYKNMAILQHRHCELHRDERGRLHSPSGMAVKYRDGWGVYAWHGVRVPAQIIENPQSITAQSIRDENNQEVRRIMMERYGWDKWLKETKSVLLDRHPDPRVGELWQFKDTDGTAIKVLRARNGTPEYDTLFGKETYREFYLRVPNEENGVKIDTALKAGKWTYPALWNTLTDQEFLEATTAGRT